jgi:hypothetical protein
METLHGMVADFSREGHEGSGYPRLLALSGILHQPLVEYRIPAIEAAFIMTSVQRFDTPSISHAGHKGYHSLKRFA